MKGDAKIFHLHIFSRAGAETAVRVIDYVGHGATFSPFMWPPSLAGRALLTLLTILCKCRRGFGIWSTQGRWAEPGETASAGQSWKGGVSPSRLWWAGKQGPLTGTLVKGNLKAAWSVKAIPPSKKAWCGQREEGREAGMRDESPCALGFNSVVPSLLFCLSWEKK